MEENTLGSSLLKPDFESALVENTRKLPISANRITNIIRAASHYLDKPETVATILESFVQNPEQVSLKLPGMYVIDALCRQKKDGSVFENAFKPNILLTVASAMKTTAKDQKGMKKLVNMWKVHGIFSECINDLISIVEMDVEDQEQENAKDNKPVKPFKPTIKKLRPTSPTPIANTSQSNAETIDSQNSQIMPEQSNPEDLDVLALLELAKKQEQSSFQQDFMAGQMGQQNPVGLNQSMPPFGTSQPYNQVQMPAISDLSQPLNQMGQASSIQPQMPLSQPSAPAPQSTGAAPALSENDISMLIQTLPTLAPKDQGLMIQMLIEVVKESPQFAPVIDQAIAASTTGILSQVSAMNTQPPQPSSDAFPPSSSSSSNISDHSPRHHQKYPDPYSAHSSQPFHEQSNTTHLNPHHSLSKIDYKSDSFERDRRRHRAISNERDISEGRSRDRERDLDRESERDRDREREREREREIRSGKRVHRNDSYDYEKDWHKERDRRHDRDSHRSREYDRGRDRSRDRDSKDDLSHKSRPRKSGWDNANYESRFPLQSTSSSSKYHQKSNEDELSDKWNENLLL
ncbi:putative CID domain [Monocercomonoides exilis]|uniref:putative CID domain n=1 Tax=Monocercomonoides exilis TaxID=2049356 RepID=UPI00355AC2B2|nr:putative CID domain [Monocercomonoides exilis]|eukprot:MONOS_8221.1-p1 / transcript=MONOS_8221.1 / gene=MONOS_8221 / organism=Monocercomonoides_exilis_PA203 / gene_product=unspecified product / transcript_product=unspecified product / location=Mono_scaffold00304:16341-18436(+) / protein_length=574 / sequence_SO=supercontig / SO=protein_coding / is_pseudo=false